RRRSGRFEVGLALRHLGLTHPAMGSVEQLGEGKQFIGGVRVGLPPFVAFFIAAAGGGRVAGAFVGIVFPDGDGQQAVAQLVGGLGLVGRCGGHGGILLGCRVSEIAGLLPAVCVGVASFACRRQRAVQAA